MFIADGIGQVSRAVETAILKGHFSFSRTNDRARKVRKVLSSWSRSSYDHRQSSPSLFCLPHLPVYK